MDTTDGPVIAALTTEAAIGAMAGAAVSVGATALMGGFKKPSKPSMPSASAAALKTEMPTKTASPVETLSEEAKKTRRKAASVLASRFGEPTLGIPGLMGA